MICANHSRVGSDWLSIGQLSAKYCISQPTIRNMCDNGLPHFTTIGNHRRISENEFRRYIGLSAEDKSALPRVCLLARVSSPSQAKPRTDDPDASSDLDRQVEICRRYVKERWGKQCVLDENIRVGSGLNWNHPKIIEFTLNLVQGKYDYVVFTYKDRVARSSYDLFSNLAQHVGTELVMIEDNDDPTFAESLVDDIVALTCVASARHNGLKFGERVRINVDAEVMIDLYLTYLTGITFEQLAEYAKKNGLTGTKGEALQKQKLIDLFQKNRRVLEMAAKERPAKENTLKVYLQTHKQKADVEALHEDYTKWCKANGKVAQTLNKVRQQLRGKATI